VLVFVAGCDGIQRERKPLSVTKRLKNRSARIPSSFVVQLNIFAKNI
jgi:hypothetical protein